MKILNSYPHSNALLTFSLQKDSENVLFAPIGPATQAAYNHLPAAYIHLSTNEKRRFIMTLAFRQYISQDILSQICDVIQSDVALHLQVH